MDTLASHRRVMTRVRMIRFLDDLDDATGYGVSLYLPPGLAVSEIELMLKKASTRDDIPPEIFDTVANSKTGAALFWGEPHKCLVLPPFPIGEKQAISAFTTEPLISLLKQDLITALILVRLGDYAIGVFEGETRISGKVGTGLVHSRHKKGGSSQRRFERHREKQMESFFSRVCLHAREHLEPQAQQLDYVIYGGERNTLLAFRKQCRFLQRFDDRTLDQLLNIRKPRQATLEEAVTEVWSSNLIEWIEN